MEKKPSYFAFIITHRCQSHCATCGSWMTPKEDRFDELSTNDWKFVLKSLRDWVGEFDFIFSGGEPFLREDIFEIANFAKEIGLQPKVITNGLALQNKCEKLIESGFTDITFSLNSMKNPYVHNNSRGRKNAFKATTDVIQNVCYLNKSRNAKKKIIIASIIMPSSLKELVSLAEFANQNGVGIIYQMLENSTFFSFNNDEEALILKNSDMKKQTVLAIDELISLKQKGYLIYNSENQLNSFKETILNSDINNNKNVFIRNCDEVFEQKEFSKSNNLYHQVDKISSNIIQKSVDIPYVAMYPDEAAIENEYSCRIGHRNFLIDPYGNVRICFVFPPIGSLITATPQNIWNSEYAEKLRKRIVECNLSCKLLNCNYEE